MTEASEKKTTGARAKLARARELRDRTKAHISEYLSDRAHLPTLAVRLDPKTRELVLFVVSVPPLENFFERIALLVGDTVHNLRCALDYCVHRLALDHTGPSLRRPHLTQFPIADTAKAFADSKDRFLGEVAPRFCAVIESFQPYHPMDAQVCVGEYFHPLAMLRDLSNVDKHRLLTPILIPSTDLSLDGPLSMLIMAGTLMHHVSRTFSGNPIAAEGMAPGLELVRSPMAPAGLTESPHVVGTSAATVAFSDGRSVVAVLDKLIRATSVVLDALEPCPAP